jgi:hypothetical protein
MQTKFKNQKTITMSDNYYKYLTMAGCSKKIAEVKKYLRTKNSDGTFIEFDMKKIIPIPKEFNDNMNGQSYLLKTFLDSKIQKNESETLQSDVDNFKNLSFDKKFQQLNYAIDLLVCQDKYQFDNYVEWSYQIRGFRNISEGEYIPGSKTIQFLTTNGNGIKVVKALAIMFPEIVFELKFDLEIPAEGYGIIRLLEFTTLQYGVFTLMTESEKVNFNI